MQYLMQKEEAKEIVYSGLQLFRFSIKALCPSSSSAIFISRIWQYKTENEIKIYC